MKGNITRRLSFLGRWAGSIFIIIFIIIFYILWIVRSSEIIKCKGALIMNLTTNDFSLKLLLPEGASSLDSNLSIQLRIQSYPYLEYKFVQNNFNSVLVKNQQNKEIVLNNIKQFVTTTRKKKFNYSIE